jgi:4-cresol dehydrogenase (hydroxylating)
MTTVPGPTEFPESNVTGVHTAPIEVCRPQTHQDVVDLIQQARRDGVPLYPVSTGLNWGYGSTSTVASGCRLVDLRNMRRLRNADGHGALSLDNPVALIEPGLTQGELYDHLVQRGLPLTFNVTGSSRDTSLLGNSLDRGVGYFGPRREDLFGLEIALGNGKTIQTGFRRLGEDSPLAHCHPYGLGPMLDGLFFQGNFGIVTSACFRLSPRRPKEVAVSLALRDNRKLGEFINQLVQLKREGLMGSVTHIANKARSQASLLYGMTSYLEEHCRLSPSAALKEATAAVEIVAPNEWTSLAAVTGNTAQVSAALKEVKARMQPLARTMVITDELLSFGFKACNALRAISKFRANAAAINAVRPLHGLALGVPTDAAIDNLMWKFGHGGEPARLLDHTNCGLLFICPALPSDGAMIVRLMDELRAIADQHLHTLYTTINVETPTSLVAVINLLFDRGNAEEVERAHTCARALLAHIRARHLEIYRARADLMADITSEDSDYWQTVRRLKQDLDPDNIIAPGRYNLM